MCINKRHKSAFIQHGFQKDFKWRSSRKDTVNIHTPNGSCVSIIGAQSFSIDRVPNIGNL